MLNQINLVESFQIHCFNIYFNIILTCMTSASTGGGSGIAVVVVVDWIWWGATGVSKLLSLRAYCSSPSDCDVDHGMIISTGLTPNSSTKAIWQPPVLSGGPVSRDISGASRRMDEGNGNLVYPSPWDFKRSFIYRKILQHGTSGSNSHLNKGVLRIFIAIKNPSPSPISNPRPLVPVANTLTTASPRRRSWWWSWWWWSCYRSW
jgi:hypothetical protein